MNSVQIAVFDCHGNRNEKKKKTNSGIFFSEAIRGMQLKLCINIHDIGLYINCIFIVVANVLSLLWQFKVSIYI